MKKRAILALNFVFFFFGLVVQAANLQTLTEYLLADRINFLATSLGDNLLKMHQSELSKKIQAITPELILSHSSSLAGLKEGEGEDDGVSAGQESQNPADLEFRVIKELLNLQTEGEQKYLNQAFDSIDRFTLMGFKRGWSMDPSQGRKVAFDLMNPETTEIASEDVTPLLGPWTKDGLDIMLDVGAYVSTRMTRGIFWEAGFQKRNLEIHYGSDNEAKYRILQRGGKFVGEVRTSAANYNKIYLVEYPNGESSYVLTRVYGRDRAKHLALQALVLPLKGQSMVSQGSRVYFFGSLEKSRERLVTQMNEDFKDLPLPDLLIVGQRGTIEAFFNLSLKLQRREAITGLQEYTSLAQNKRNEFDQIMKAPLAHLIQWDDFEPLVAAIRKFKVSVVPSFAIQYPSHDVSDFLIRTISGSVQRVRLVENVWGDEMVPIVTALQNAKPKKIVYIGTAGAFPNKGLKVGDIVAPKVVYINEETKLALKDPEFIFPTLKRTGMNEKNQSFDLALVNVFSLFAETRSWFDRVSPGAAAVEVEINHVRQVMPEVQVYLMISDIVGSETEDLSANSSGARQMGRNLLLTEIFNRLGMMAPENPSLNPSSVVDGDFADLEAAKKDTLNAFLILQKAKCSHKDIMAVAQEEVNFQDRDLLGKLMKMELIFEQWQDQGYSVSVDPSLMNGTWNPKLALPIQIINQQGALVAPNQGVGLTDKDMFQLSSPSDGSLTRLQLNRTISNELLEMYSQEARGSAGISIRANPSGEYKAYKVYGKTRFETAKCQAH